MRPSCRREAWDWRNGVGFLSRMMEARFPSSNDNNGISNDGGRMEKWDAVVRRLMIDEAHCVIDRLRSKNSFEWWPVTTLSKMPLYYNFDIFNILVDKSGFLLIGIVSPHYRVCYNWVPHQKTPSKLPPCTIRHERVPSHSPQILIHPKPHTWILIARMTTWDRCWSVSLRWRTSLLWLTIKYYAFHIRLKKRVRMYLCHLYG